MSTQQRVLKDEILLNGGLDTDSDEKFVQQGDYVDAVNVMKLEDGSGGILVNVKGNEAVYQPDFGNDSHLCGWGYYDKNESVILFFYNYFSLSDDDSGRIMEYNPKSNTATEIVFLSYYNYTYRLNNPKTNDYFVKVDISGDWLAWTDNTAMTRMLNIEDVKNGDVTVDDAYLDLCRRPPLDVPIFKFDTDSTIYYNNLDGAYQFKYRYVYSDYRPSVFSKASDIAISKVRTRSTDVSYVGQADNILYVKFNSGDANVGWIDIVVRDGNTGAWGRVVKIDKSAPENVYTYVDNPVLIEGSLTSLSDNTDYYYRFTNSEGRLYVGDEGTKQYDVIPDTSETLSFLGEGNLALGGNVSGKDLIDLDVTLTEEHNNPGFFEDWLAKGVTLYNTGSGITYSYAHVEIIFDFDDLEISSRDVWLPGDNVYFNWECTITTNEGNSVISLDQYIVIDEKLTNDEFGNYIDTHPSDLSVSGIESISESIEYDSTTNEITFTINYETATLENYSLGTDATIVQNTGYDYSRDPSTTDVGGYLSDQGFKVGHSHKLALIYQDKYGRKYPAQTSTGTTIEIDSKAGSSDEGFGSIKYVIQNDPPTDAVSYRWAYAYKPKSFVQTVITDVSFFDDGSVDTAKLVALDVSGNNALTYTQYTIEVGDVLKILRPGDGYDFGSWSDDEPSFIIEDVRSSINDGTDDLNGKWIVVRLLERFRYSADDIDTITSNNFLNAIVEIYKPQTEFQEELFYEIGGGGTVDTSETTGYQAHKDWATGEYYGYLNSGDVWVRPLVRYKRYAEKRDKVELQTLYLETPYPTSDSVMKNVGIGDVNQEYLESRKKYDNTIVYSRKYFQDTQVNGLSSFDAARKKDLSDSFGKIKGLEELGNILTIICEEKVLTAYIGATEYTDASGNTNVIKSTEPIGYIRPHAERYGTFLKESICNNGRYVYFYDLLNGVVVRKAYNGLQTISGVAQSQAGTLNYKMRSYFKALSDNLIDSLYDSGAALYKDVKCYMGYDYYHENLYVSFIDRVDSTNSVLLIFNEPTNKWVSKQSFTDAIGNYATMYPFTKSNIFGFLETVGDLYKLNSDDALRCYFYGVQQDSYIQFVSHALPNRVKIFNSIAIHSDDEWDVNPIEIKPTTNYPNGMYSKIVSSDWVKEDGVYKASFNRNMKTNSSTATNYDLREGEELRGYVVKAKMTNDNTSQTELFKVDINSELVR